MDALSRPENSSESEPQLGATGLTVREAQAVLLAGYVFRRSLTSHNTKVIRGVGTYDAMSKALADTYLPDPEDPEDAEVAAEWRTNDHNGFRRLINVRRNIAIVVNSGYPIKEGGRKAIRNAVERNRLLLARRADDGQSIGGPVQGHLAFIDEDSGVDGVLTYFLLHRIRSRSITAELSLPTSIVDGKLSGFAERYSIPDPLEGYGLSTEDEADDPDDSDYFDVEVNPGGFDAEPGSAASG